MKGFSPDTTKVLIAADQTNLPPLRSIFILSAAQIPSRKQHDLPGEESYCEGYRRGFALGHADGFLLRPEGGRLEASK